AALPCDADDPVGYAEQDERESEHRVRVGGASGVSDRITGNAKNGPETTGRARPLCQLRKGAARPPHAPGASLCARSAGTAGIGDHEFSPSIMSGDRSAGWRRGTVQATAPGLMPSFYPLPEETDGGR